MALAVVSTLLASACCVLPLALVLAGITGAWMANLAVFKPFTPVFYAIAVGALARAGWLVLRPAPACSTVEAAACEFSRPVMRRVYFVCTGFVALLLLFPLAAPLFY